MIKLSENELSSLKKYSFNNSNLLLTIHETVDNKFCIRPIRWSGHFSKGKFADGECLAYFDTKDNAINTLIEICGYSRNLAMSLS